MFSPCRRYRYRLERDLPVGLDTGNVMERTCAFIMLNPSTADETVNDPTIRRCIGFAAAWGFHRLLIGNLFALRSTDPAALYTANDPGGPDNETHLKEIAEDAELVICAWGVHGAHLDRGAQVADMLLDRGKVLHHLGLTKEGFPGHPLYKRADATPMVWSRR